MNSATLGVVYEIICTKNNKRYFGQTINFKRRIWEHIHNLDNNLHRNHYLQQDWNLYSKDAFEFNILAKDIDLANRIKLETQYIQEYGGIECKDVYNYQDNITENLEMRKLVSDHQKGKVVSKESIEKRKQKMLGYKHSEETIQKIKNGCKKFIGENNPAKRPDVRKKISEKVSGENNGFYGKHHTDEAKERIRKSRLGKLPGNAGKLWVNNSVTQLLIKPEELEQYLSNGYTRGKIKTSSNNIKV